MNTLRGTAMPLVKVQEKGQVTLPTKIRREVGLDPGDYVTIEREGDRIVLIPQEIAPRHPEIDAAIAEGLADIRAGRVSPAFDSAEEFHVWLETDEGKKFANAK
jgi:AbrB family looped-hinge helix DNA binding protein